MMSAAAVFFRVVSTKTQLLEQIEDLTTVKNELTTEVRILSVISLYLLHLPPSIVYLYIDGASPLTVGAREISQQISPGRAHQTHLKNREVTQYLAIYCNPHSFCSCVPVCTDESLVFLSTHLFSCRLI